MAVETQIRFSLTSGERASLIGRKLPWFSAILAGMTLNQRPEVLRFGRVSWYDGKRSVRKCC